MTRRNRRTHSSLRARFASLVGGAAIAFSGVLVGAPAHAEVVVDDGAELAAECATDAFAINLLGTITLDLGDIAISHLRIDGVDADSSDTFTALEDGSVFEVSATTPLFEDADPHAVEWIVNDKVFALGEFSYLTACEAAVPTPTPTVTPGPTESPTPSPTPTSAPTPTPTSTSTPTPTAVPEPTTEPTEAPTPTEEPVPSEEPSPSEEPEPEPSVPAEPTETPAPVPAAPVVTVSSASVPAGGSVTVKASGFAPGERLELWLHSTPWKMMDATANADGALSVSVTLAGGTELGDHSIEVRGASSGSAFVDITVNDDLAITGIDSAFASGVATTGVVLVLGGLSVVLLARRARFEALG